MHIVVTGASSGIGRALARAFDRPGARLSLVARRGSELEELSRELACQSCPIVADLARTEDPVAWLDEAEKAFGPTDVLVNNAGMSYVEPVSSIEPARVQSVFQVNVHTPIAAIHRVLPNMQARRAGTIVNVASNAAFSPAPYFTHYCATKSALANFSESLRMELRAVGVNVVTVYPGPVETPMADRNWKQLEDGVFRRMAPRGRADVLATLIVRAVERRSARVIYPRFYALGWWLPGIGRFVAERFLPQATGERTPPMPGDVTKPG